MSRSQASPLQGSSPHSCLALVIDWVVPTSLTLIGGLEIVLFFSRDRLGMRLFFLSLITFLLAVTMRPDPVALTSSSPPVHDHDRDEPWYTPMPEDFRPFYDRDATNREKQTWDQYWSWVKAFYGGNFLSHGWTERSKGLVTVVKSNSERKTLRATINAVGREIGAEWAKDYDVRTVSSAELLAWGKLLQKAKDKDDGTVRSSPAIDSIRDEHVGSVAGSRLESGSWLTPRDRESRRVPVGRVRRAVHRIVAHTS